MNVFGYHVKCAVDSEVGEIGNSLFTNFGCDYNVFRISHSSFYWKALGKRCKPDYVALGPFCDFYNFADFCIDVTKRKSLTAWIEKGQKLIKSR